jgi:hypothetical protein
MINTIIFKDKDMNYYSMVPNKYKPFVCIIPLLCFLLVIDADSLVFATTGDAIPFSFSKGYGDGDIVLFIATDTSDNQTASSMTASLGHKINYVPELSSIPKSYIQQGYDFINGVKGEGGFGFQLPVASALPGDKGYSPLVQLNLVKWVDTANARLLKSSQDIEQAQRNGEIQIIKTKIIINSPAISQK